MLPLFHPIRMCYRCAVARYDILIDDMLKPWLIEVNQTPSFAADTTLDEVIKRRLITDAFRII